MRLGPALATCALVALLGTACGSDDEPEPVSAVEPPDNLCAAVPDNVVERWGLTEDDHASDAAGDRSTATCTMSGTAADAPVTLEISLTSYGGADADAVRALVADEVAARCDELDQAGGGRFKAEDTRCSTESDGSFTEVSTAIPAHGVVTVTMSHDGQMSQLLPAEVVGLSGTVANAEPGDL
ncbi:hypothetical protein [Nocardioides caricicola]|uniref:DUF4333 domain-containing protein n=1 Tax=Nocardioides caricicola TaxID=634770 RepID=A0ABW0N127_9ACTN